MGMESFNNNTEPQERQMPGPETEPVEQQIEQNEGKESLEARYDRLVKEALGIKHDREITFRLSVLQSEGLQTLIDEYGADPVFDVIKIQLQKTKGQQGTFSTFEVIRALEPDKAKRGALYERMLGDAKEEAEQFEEELKSNNAEDRHYFKLMYGSGGNLVRGTQFRIEAMKSLDSVFGKIAPNRHYKFLGSRMNEFATYVSQTEVEETKIKEELKQAGDDIFRLVEERSKNTDSRTEKLRTEAGELNEEILTEIQRITQELNTRLEEYRARVLSDIGKIGNMETASEEMRTALQETLSKVEGDIVTRVEATQKEIEDRTAPLRQMMSSATNLDRI